MSGARIAVFVGTEVLAALGAAAVQQAQGASIERQIAVAVGAIAIVTFLWAVARFIGKPLLHNWFFAVIRHEPERAAAVMVRALDINDDTRAILRRFIDRLYADKIAADQETRDMAERTRDEMVWLKESNALQGAAITKDIAHAMESIAHATKAQAAFHADSRDDVDTIKRELAAHAELIGRLEERVTYLDGHERRNKPR